jgi:hypothetical protein
MRKAVQIGPDAGRWAGEMIRARGIEGVRVLQGFVSLSRNYPARVINQAGGLAVKGNLFRLRPIRELCKRLNRYEKDEFTAAHPIIRPLSEYQDVIHVLFNTETEERR